MAARSTLEPCKSFSDIAAEQHSNARRGDLRGIRWPLILILVVLLLSAYAGSIKPMLDRAAAQTWPMVPCTITISKVVVSGSGKHRSSRILIQYAYAFNGTTYQGGDYDFVQGRGLREKDLIVARHPLGSLAACYVNPADPKQSLLDRRFHRGYLISLIPPLMVAAVTLLVFFLIWLSDLKKFYPAN